MNEEQSTDPQLENFILSETQKQRFQVKNNFISSVLLKSQ